MQLNCDNLRVDVSGEPLLECFDVDVAAHRLALVGDFSALFCVLSGRAEVLGGSFRVNGVDARDAVIRGEVGLVLAEPVFASRWTVLELLKKSAVLVGLPRAAAENQALSVLKRLQLLPFAQRALATLGRAELAALGLAQALLTDPRVIAAEAPFRALGSAASDWLWSLFKNAIEGRQLVVSFDEAVLDSRALIREFDQVVLLHTGKLVAVGPPSEVLQAGAYLVSVTRRAASFRRELEAQGCEVRATKLDDELPSQLLIRASGQDLAGIIARTATQHEIPVIELVPLPRAPSGSSGSDVGRAI